MLKINMKEYNLDYFKSKDLYTWNEIIEIIEEMERDIFILHDRVEELESDIKDNYVRVSVAKQVEVSDRDFI